MSNIFLCRNWNRVITRPHYKNGAAIEERERTDYYFCVSRERKRESRGRNEERAERARSAQGIYYSALTSSCNSLARHKVDCKYALSPGWQRRDYEYDGSRSYWAHAIARHYRAVKSPFCTHRIYPRAYSSGPIGFPPTPRFKTRRSEIMKISFDASCISHRTNLADWIIDSPIFCHFRKFRVYNFNLFLSLN